MSRFAFARSLFGVAVLLLAGCGGSGRHGVSGQVSYKGKPLPSGQIRFDPMPGGSASAGATITDGKYAVPAELGLPPGKYKVFISAVGGSPVAADVIPGSQPIVEVVDLLPEKYNAKTTLTCDVVAGKNVHDFPLD